MRNRRRQRLASAALGLLALLTCSPAHAAFIGWGVGSGGGLVRSTDDGNTWQNFAANAGFSSGVGHFHPDLYSVAFPDPQNGWIAGVNGVMLHTTNGGLSWTSQTTHISNSIILDVQFVEANNGWAVGTGGAIVHTSDGGAHWTVQASGTASNLNGVRFIDPLSGWALGANGTILRSVDGGLTWTPQVSGTSYPLFNARFVNSSEGWALGYAQTLLHTTNAGTTWIPLTGPYGPSGIAGNLADAAFFDALHAWVVDDLGIGYTADGGNTWTQQLVGALAFNRINFPDPLNGWVSESTDLYHTTDGGLTWTYESMYPTIACGVTDTVFITAPEPSCLALLLSAPLLLCRRPRFRHRPK